MEGYGENVVLIAIGRGPPLRYRIGNANSRRFPYLVAISVLNRLLLLPLMQIASSATSTC